MNVSFVMRHLMEEASEAERRKASRAYDGMPDFSPDNKQTGEQLLTRAATLECTYQAFHASGDTQVFRSELDELGHLYQQWLCELNASKNSLRMQSAEPKVLEYVSTIIDHMGKRIRQLAG
ncbi:hypothetical protein ALP90_200173 [Pseudomonas amygdali pv. ulmi]|uniref:Uncharacterized protein n=3 Tax=Pseudomonas amygdali TaxID=47877 RepID=A0A3M4S854_PSEA0|nr:hypothetical protein ALP90_200173 [Pseudomonas amygdali pv. ulmi]